MFTVVTGGSASGKSEYAEKRIVSAKTNPLYYIATMIPFDDECRERIARHRQMRSAKGFVTVERPLDLAGWDCPAGAGALLECMSNLAANEFYRAEQASEQDPASRILAGVRKLASSAGELVVVTNEVFSDGVEYPPEIAAYLDCLARVNREMAAMADRVVEVVYTLPIFQKGVPGE